MFITRTKSLNTTSNKYLMKIVKTFKINVNKESLLALNCIMWEVYKLLLRFRLRKFSVNSNVYVYN